MIRSFLILVSDHWDDRYNYEQAYSLMMRVDLVAVRDADDNFSIKKDRSGKLDYGRLYSKEEFFEFVKTYDNNV